MGTFAGHVIPGGFLFCTGIYWTWCIFYRYFYAKRFRPTSYRNVSWFSGSSLQRLPPEILMKITLISIGIAAELSQGILYGKFQNKTHHMTMYFFFLFNSIVELLQHRKWDLPPKLDYASMVLAFGIEGFLFYNHLHGRSHMNIQVHMFLFYTIVCCVAAVFVEMQKPKSVLAALTRAFFVILHGTWFFQIGFVLFPPLGQKWDEEDHEQMMVVTLMFAWHVAAILIAMSIFGLIIYSRVQKLKAATANYHLVETTEMAIKSEKTERSNGYLQVLGGGGETNQMLDSESEDV